MSDFLYKKLNTTKTIVENLPRIIDVFVSFYGEENRTYIENKFRNLLIIGYGNPENLRYILSKIEKNKSNELIDSFFNKLNISTLDRNDLKNKIFSFFDLDYSYLTPISEYIKYKELDKNDKLYNDFKKKAFNFLKSFNSNLTLENMEILEKEGAFLEIDKLIPLYKEIVNLYNEEINKLNNYEEESKYYNKLKNELENKYFKELLDEFSYLIPLDEKEKIKTYFDRSLFDCPITKSYFAISLTCTSLIDAFSLENENLLINGFDWQKNSIKNDRIEFFKKNGFDFGNNYDLYMENLDCIKIIPSYEIINKIKSKKKELNDLLLNEYYKSTNEYKFNRERIKEKNLLIKDDGYNVNAYVNGYAFVSPNLTYKDEEYVLFPIMCINNYIEEYMDKTIIHEFNHVLELDLVSKENNRCHFCCGWDILEESLDSYEEKIESLEKITIKREYELFNEIINEMIAQEITTNMHENGIYIFNDKNNAKIKGGTSYENSLFLVNSFFEKYKKEIILSRRDGNIEILFNKVGKENFESLNELFHGFYETFNNSKYYSLLDDISNKKDTELTRKFSEIISKRDHILNLMNEYNLEYSKQR